ncbi:MAG: ATP-binding protein [Gammaproteobacteria bacterium]|nr:ATP-binding protein [Gammaproteobacteria bacterium]
MLLEFNVANYKSIKEQQTFSMLKTAGKELEGNTFESETPVKFDLLRSSVIYGANGSGKSNLLKALGAMRNIVLTSAQRGIESKIGVKPYLLDAASENQPTEFEITFVSQQVRYQYGFSTTQDQVLEEWLIAYPKGKAQSWFNRAWDSSTETYKWKFSSSFLGQKQAWLDSTRSNALFLSTAVNLNSELLKPVYAWFVEKLHITNIHGWPEEFSTQACLGEGKENILKLFKNVDLAIEDLALEKVSVIDSMPDEMPDVLRKALIQGLNLDGQEKQKVSTLRKRLDGTLVKLPLGEESDGTQRFFSLAGPWLDALQCGDILVIDELHSQLHPKLVRFLVSLFHSKATNPNKAQLIFTTHETSILNQNIFRRDQIWFCEIKPYKGTDLYRLTDFRVRPQRENIEAAYLSGKFGATPYISPAELL